MNHQTCSYESAVVAAVKSEQWTDDLRAHAASCPMCQETVTITSALQRIALKTAGEAPVSYRILWLRAQFVRKQENLSKLDRFMLVGSFAVFFVGLLGIALWKWPLVQSWLTNGSGNTGTNLPLYIAAACAALVWFLTEEVFEQDK